MANGSPPMGYSRIGILPTHGNEANSRSENIPIIAMLNMMEAARHAVNSPATAAAVKNAIAGIIGPQWKLEADDWYLVTLLTHSVDWSEAERQKVVELFGA